MKALEHVPDWENDPIAVITLPPSAMLITRVPLWYAIACQDKRPGLQFKSRATASDRLASAKRQRDLRNRKKRMESDA